MGETAAGGAGGPAQSHHGRLPERRRKRRADEPPRALNRSTPAPASPIRFDRLGAAGAAEPLVLHFEGRLDDRALLLADAPGHERELPDAPLLLARYRRLGEAFLDEVRGAFALVLSDPGAGRCLAARDGMGKRSAAYVLRPDLFAVTLGRGAAGAPALLELPGVSRELDPLRLLEYYGFEELSGPATFFRDVRDLLPGEVLIVERDAVKRRWLPRPRLDLRPRLSWEEAVECFAELLATAVARALRGHDRAAVWVSGGLDSTPLAALAARMLPAGGPLPAVHGIFWQLSDAAGDESAFVEAFGRESGVPLSAVPCDDALPFDDLAHWPVNPETPEQTSYRWFHERSYARARELGHDLVLTGFGGDSLYGSARRWFWHLALAEGPGPAIARLREVAAREGWPLALRREVVGALLPARRSLWRPAVPGLTDDARRALASRPRWPPDLLTARRPRQAERVLSLLDAHGEHVESWYAARHGLAYEVPLQDFDLAQFLLNVPDHFLRRGTETRSVLRSAIRGLVPEEVRRRVGKASFRAVLMRGLEPRRLAWAAPLLRRPEASWRPFVQPAAIDRWLAGDHRDDGEILGLLLAIFAELWQYTRAGGELASLQPRP